ncbi:peptidoglycan DD-metalloendopeptidase family protein [Salmonirosea aquatica]|uniref:Peptidoglycan DD-metalloendopeptidase family protein n=1 Tax=Salmonirosea aquatica TaxID=2654236 RepID=A0A7C9BUL2_9BACT|nr:peptidoglycan DD-metalloendopeptidase family protein [Cytophagaceae bacterium SJW1-29]
MSRRLTLIAAVTTILVFAAAQLLFIDFNDSFFSPHPEHLAHKSAPLPPPAPVVYGIPTDSLNIVEGVIKSGETMSTLLATYNIGSATVHELAQKARGVFKARNLRTNRPYTLLHTADEARTARYLIYEPNDVEYVIYDLRDSLAVTLHQRPIDVVERELVGEIRGSLYQSILNAGGSAQLVDKLADIYAWRLDLNRVQVGDTFKLIFEEKQVNGKTIGNGQLKAAYIEHNGQPLYAIGFDQGQGIDYYDQDGQSFKKAFLKEPVEYSRISSRYTNRRFHPVQKRFKAHLGTDFAAPRGTPIRTVGDGVVLEAGRTLGNGNYVKIRHNKTYTTQYLHMSKFAKGIRRGTRVSMGQTIGYVGSTGLSTGPHLCYRFWKNGRQVDALKEKLPLANPVQKAHLTAFFQVKDTILGRMEAMDTTQTQQEMLAARRAEADPSSI